MKFFALIFVLVFLAVPAQAQEGGEHPSSSASFLEDHDFRVGLDVGASFDPSRFMIVARGEYSLDRYFTLGPMIQFGLGSNREVFIPTFGGRYRLPIYGSDRLEWSVFSGMGTFGRKALGQWFYHFNFAVGSALEFFLVEKISVGLGMIFNVTSSSTERTLTVVNLGMTYHF